MMDHGLSAARRGALLACLGTGLLCGCDDSPPPAPEVRPVATVRVAYAEEPAVSAQVGEIRPHYESDLGFRIGGRIAERAVLLGQVLRTGEVVARLDPQDQRNQMVAAEADLAAAKASLVQAAAEEKRKVELHAGGWATAAALEAAQKAKASAAAGVSAAQAKLRLARDQLDYATLRAPADGAVTALGAEAGQVVGAGQMVVRFARLDRKEAVFALSQAVLHDVPEGARVSVSLLDAPEVTTRGAISEIAPSADAVTRTYTVKVALPDAPETMRLGMSVVGRIEAGTRRVAELPSSALFQDGGMPAVWVVDAASSTVSLSRVEVARLDAGTARIAGGVPEGARVVTAGVQTLRPGQTVRLNDEAGR